jgi:hypothetical protein
MRCLLWGILFLCGNGRSVPGDVWVIDDLIRLPSQAIDLGNGKSRTSGACRKKTWEKRDPASGLAKPTSVAGSFQPRWESQEVGQARKERRSATEGTESNLN